MSNQCKYMKAAYPDLSGYDTCDGFHEHSKDVFSLARALAEVFQRENPTDEQIAWFLNDADAIARDYEDSPFIWNVAKDTALLPPGCSDSILVNGVQYVVPESEWEPSTPERRSTYMRDRELSEGDLDDDDWDR